ncbi:MAG TPA: amidohydrolase family protein [Gemmatimonadaceae bacterium]|nr:amidohydrolase family protein [Gemmatimonadaceae bacterium]
MRGYRSACLLAGFVSTVVVAPLTAQNAVTPATPATGPAARLSREVRQFTSVTEPVVALVNVTVIDGTGSAPRTGQTVVVDNGRIASVGPSASVTVPAGARRMELAGHTVIPGIVGMHDHLFYTAVGGRAAQMSFTGPRLYLASGVTTIRTTGGRSPYAELNARAMIDSGRLVGPRIHFTAPYLTGDVGGAAGSMAQVGSPDAARRFVAYWAQEGATWIKIYADIRRAELGAAVEEAHNRGIKVTGHLCSVTFQEAVDLGIDNLEHGLLTATDFDAEKRPDHCPTNSMVRTGSATPSSAAWQATIRKMVDKKVGMTSTLAVFEPFFQKRPVSDERTLEMMTPALREAYVQYLAGLNKAKDYPLTTEMLHNAMAFEKAFVDAGGLLAAGVDPTGVGGALPGFGDQRNYELLVEAGFSPAQTVQVMSLNGARILGVADRLGSVEKGKVADLVVLQGDLAADPAAIRRVTTVFKDGVGYDSPRLLATVRGRVGID